MEDIYPYIMEGGENVNEEGRESGDETSKKEEGENKEPSEVV